MGVQQNGNHLIEGRQNAHKRRGRRVRRQKGGQPTNREVGDEKTPRRRRRTFGLASHRRKTQGWVISAWMWRASDPTVENEFSPSGWFMNDEARSTGPGSCCSSDTSRLTKPTES